MAQIHNFVSGIQKRYPIHNALDELVMHLEDNPSKIPDWLNFEKFRETYDEPVETDTLLSWIEEVDKYTQGGVNYVFKGLGEFSQQNELELGHFVAAYWFIGPETNTRRGTKIPMIHNTSSNLIKDYLEHHNIIYHNGNQG